MGLIYFFDSLLALILILSILLIPLIFIHFTEPKKKNYIMFFLTLFVVYSYFMFNTESTEEYLSILFFINPLGKGMILGWISLFISLFSLMKKSWTFGKTFYNSNRVVLIFFCWGWVMKIADNL